MAVFIDKRRYFLYNKGINCKEIATMKKALILLLTVFLLATSLVACKQHNASKPNPASDFEYKVDGNQISITKYVGTDTTVIIPEAIEEKIVTVIGSEAFAASTITECVLPATIRKIDPKAFATCVNLEKITLNEGLLTIGDYAFEGAGALTEIVIPATVINLNESTFKSCNALTAVKFEGNAPNAYENPEAGVVHDPSFGVSYTVYYHASAEGFSPNWCGYNTANW